MDCSQPGSSVHGISQARVQEWVGAGEGGLPGPGMEHASPALHTESLPSEPADDLSYSKL